MTHIPAVAGHVPPYKAWAFLLNNERAVQTGRQMFYIDASGEVSGLAARSAQVDSALGLQGCARFLGLACCGAQCLAARCHRLRSFFACSSARQFMCADEAASP